MDIGLMNKLENICLDENGIKKKKLNSRERISTIKIDKERNSLMTEAGERTIDNRYLQPGETAQEMFARVAGFYADDAPQAQRLYEYFLIKYIYIHMCALFLRKNTANLSLEYFINV